MMGHSTRATLRLAVALAALAAPALAVADVPDRLYDFTDAYYAQNGLDPALIDGRRQVGPLAAEDKPNFAYQRPVRALLTLPAYDHSGNSWYFTVLGGASDGAFTRNAAGTSARRTADQSPEYIFPRQGTDPLGLGALRQSVLLDMRNGYFSNNRLGLWLHTWVAYTPKALATASGKKALADIAKKNGLDLDGTPIIKSVSEIEDLFKKGYVTKTLRPLNDPLRYAICPVVKDPTDGGIAPDQFLAITRKPDGSPLEPDFLRAFEAYQKDAPKT